jgi:hypothetical protein
LFVFFGGVSGVVSLTFSSWRDLSRSSSMGGVGGEPALVVTPFTMFTSSGVAVLSSAEGATSFSLASSEVTTASSSAGFSSSEVIDAGSSAGFSSSEAIATVFSAEDI